MGEFSNELGLNETPMTIGSLKFPANRIFTHITWHSSLGCNELCIGYDQPVGTSTLVCQATCLLLKRFGRVLASRREKIVLR